MFSIAIIVFREVLEIALILGVLLAATKGLSHRAPWVWLGLLLGIAAAGVVALFADAISQAALGMGQEMMNATILLIAAALIGWTIIWMHRNARAFTQRFKKIGAEVIQGVKPKYTLSIVVALAVLREGSEIVMFLYSSLVTGNSIHILIIGSLIGLGMGAAAGFVIYYGLIQMPIKKVLTVTSGLLMLLVSGMVAEAFGYLSAAGRVPDLIPMLWDTSHLISAGSLLGRIMHILIGYTDRPSGIQLVAYVVTLSGLWFAVKTAQQASVANAKQGVIIILLGMIGSFSLSSLAYAEKRVFAPEAEQGEWEIENTGTYDIDPAKNKNAIQEYHYAVGYGVNSFWHTELEIEAETQSRDDAVTSFQATHMEWENIFQLADKGRYWLDPGVYLAYEAPLMNKQVGQFEGKILLEKDFQKVSHILNISFNQEIGGGANPYTDAGISWSSKYRLFEYFQPGFEYWNDFKTMAHQLDFQQQGHQVGPCVYGRLWGHVKYDIGYLFAITQISPRGELKWALEYEF